MAKFSCGVFCERAVVDATTNNISLINVLDEFHPPQPKPPPATDATAPKKMMPLYHYICAFVSFWERTDSDKPERPCRVRTRLHAPSGKKLIEMIHDLDLSEFPRARLIGHLPGVPVPEEGVYVWRVAYERSKDRWVAGGSVRFSMSFIRTVADAVDVQERARRAIASYRQGGKEAVN
jgi:hypothetical protein